MYPVINLHQVDCHVCRSNLRECVHWGVPLTPAETAPEQITGPQPPIFINSEGEDEGHLPPSPFPESPQHQSEVLIEDVQEQGEEDESADDADDGYDGYDGDDEDDGDDGDNDDGGDEDDWTPQDTILHVFGQSHLTIQLPEVSTQFVTDLALDSLRTLMEPVHEYLRRNRTNRNTQMNPCTVGLPGEAPSTSPTCAGSSSGVSNPSQEEDDEVRLICAIRSAQANQPTSRPTSPGPFDCMVPEYGRDHPLLAMKAWRADAWGASFGAAGENYTPGWYPIYHTPPSTDASRPSNTDLAATAQTEHAQHSSGPENTPRDPDEVRAHSSSAAPAVGQSGRSQREQSRSRKRSREANSPSSSHSSESESSPSKMRRENEQE
ncbi:uncharacterized protein LOC118241435 [Electrophorus electricus]|uniref:uncharacterized protein LOC118241435 n=2 Tax=Electrophorus electricus TaxID=8005 RepID=UPI0015D084C3|nr:uncharacterized protein LOC118241435 [Electrophorus electricus]